MEHEIRKAAVYCAVFVCFLLALVSWAYDCGPGVCASRALVGALVIYGVVSVAGGLVVKILVGAMVESKLEKQQQDRKE